MANQDVKMITTQHRTCMKGYFSDTMSDQSSRNGAEAMGIELRWSAIDQTWLACFEILSVRSCTTNSGVVLKLRNGTAFQACQDDIQGTGSSL